VLAADLSPDGQLVALGGSGRVVKVFSGSDGAQKYRLAKHTDWIIAVAFSPDGRYVVTGDRAGGIHMWEAATGGIALSLSEHKDAITALEWRADSRLLASASEDGAVIVWDAKDGWPAATLSGAHAFAGGKKGRAGVTALAWLSDGRLATAGRDRRVRLWEGGGALVGAWDALDSLPTRLSALDGGGELFVGDDAGGLHRLETRDGKMRLQTIGR
jgi:WD40 repeat protein